jgi:histidine phosphotransferase ChpT
MADQSSGFDLHLMELICSRLCHDLISPVGAVSNGLELMAEEADEELMADARRLVESSCQRAAALLQLHRSAYGNAGNQADFGPTEAVKLAREVVDGARVQLDANVTPGGNWPSGFGKLILNGILVVLEWLPRGGKLVLTISGSSETVGFELSVEGSHIIANANCAHLLQCDRSHVEVTVHNIQPYFTGLIAKAHGFRLEMAQPAAGKAILKAKRAV